MFKAVFVIAIIALGFFMVLVFNTNTKPKGETLETSLNLSSPSSAPINALAAPSNSPTPENQTINKTTTIIKTEKGDIELTLYSKEAPNTVNNFIQKAKSGFYNNLIFHRVEDWVVQGGDPMSNGTGGGDMPVEFNSKPFVIGSLGIASRGDGKVQNDSQFFITKKDSQFLDGKYTNFGIVTKGMDVVESLQIGDKILGITFQ